MYYSISKESGGSSVISEFMAVSATVSFCINVRQEKYSDLGGCLNPDVVWGWDDADVRPSEVVYDAEQHPAGPGHWAGKGRVAPNFIQLVANTTPRKQCLEEERRGENAQLELEDAVTSWYL